MIYHKKGNQVFICTTYKDKLCFGRVYPFSENLLENESYEKGIKLYLESKGIYDYVIEEREKGNIPMTCFPFDKFNSNSLLHIGTAGGWTKASTGFTFMNTIRNINSLIIF